MIKSQSLSTEVYLSMRLLIVESVKLLKIHWLFDLQNENEKQDLSFASHSRAQSSIKVIPVSSLNLCFSLSIPRLNFE